MRNSDLIYASIVYIMILISGFLFPTTSLAQVNPDSEKSINRDTIIYMNKNMDEISHSLIQKFHNSYLEGFLEVKADSLIKNDSTILLIIDKNNQYRYDWIQLIGLTEDELIQINPELDKYRNRIINPQDLELIKSRIISWLENNGYPFARIETEIEKVVDHHVCVKLVVTKNKHYKVNEIKIKGFSDFNHKLIYRHLGIAPGSIYNENLLLNTSRLLRYITFLEEIRPHEVEFKTNSAILYMYLKEKKSNSFNGILGIASNDNTSSRLLLTGDINLNLTNTLKQGESFQLNWKKLEESSQDLELSFKYPYVVGSPFGLEADFIIEKKDSSYLNSNSSLGIQYMFTGGNYLKLFYSNQTSNILLTKETDYADIKTNWIGLGFQLRRLDNQYNPGSGYFFYCDMAAGYEAENINKTSDDAPRKKLKIQGDIYVKLFRNATLAFQSKTALLYGKKLYENELFRIGGYKNLRGFDEKSLDASFYQVLSLEPRYLLDQYSNFYIFYDIAYMESNYLEYNNSGLFMGFGLGSAFSTNAGIFNLSYAFGKYKDNPVQFKNAKLHFGYTSMF